MDKHSLNASIRRLFETGENDPYIVAAQLLEDLNPSDYHEVLSITLPSYTRVLAGRQRKVKDSFTHPIYVKSRGWIDMSELTVSDCREVAAAYRSLAEQNLAKAEEFETWARRLEITGLPSLGKLADFKEYMSERTRKGMAQAKAAGRHIGRPVREEDVAVRLRIIEMSATMSYGDIVATLNTEGTFNRDGRPWTYNAVYKIVNSKNA